MEFIPIKTRIMMPPKDEIWDVLDDLDVRDGDIVFITSKVLAIHQGRCVAGVTTAPDTQQKCNNKTIVPVNKETLIKQESTRFCQSKNRAGFVCCLTVTDNILIPNAGIDESNANGHYILWPKETDKLCREIRTRLCKKNNIKNLGVISTDSHTTPLRWGVTGITTGFAGIKPLKDIRGNQDIFGREIQSVRVNMIDPLSAMAVLLMGEAAEQTPIVILRGYKNIEFCNKAGMEDFTILPEDDIYGPLLEVMKKE